MSVFFHCRQNLYFLIGFILGLGLSFLLVIKLDGHCFLFSMEVISPNSNGNNDPSVYDEYEPKINLAGKPQKAQKTPQTLVRPRYFSTELGIREKLFVGVLTSHESISSCGIALNKTMSHLVNKLMFFINTPSPQHLNVSELKLPGIVRFTNTRSLLKPFHSLKYISDNFIDEYDFFFLIKNEAYVKARSLMKLVNSISVSEEIHAGVKSEPQSPYCSLDSGLLLSNLVMQKIQENIEWCVKNAFSDSDDDNVGRCILHSSNIPCQQKLKNYLFESFKVDPKFDFQHTFTNYRKQEKFDKALTIHPLQKPYQFFKLHAFFSEGELERTKQEILALRNDLVSMSVHTPGGPAAVIWPIGNQPGNKPQSRFDVLHWDHFNDSHVFFDSDFSNLRLHTTPERIDIQNIIKSCVSKAEHKYEGQLEYKKLLNGYRKFDPSRGMDYILDLIFKDVVRGKYVHKRFEVCKPLGKVELLPVPYVTENTRVNILLPIKPADRDFAVKFLQQYRQICMMKRDKTFLMMVLLYDATAPGKGTKADIFKNLKDTAVNYSKQFNKDGSKVVWVSIKVPNKHQLFTAYHDALIDFAIVDLALKKFKQDSLVLLARPNMEIKPDYLNRVRMNTILKWQVFSPIPFREFHPNIVYENEPPVELEISKQTGHYDSLNTQHISFYTSDYYSARKNIENTIPFVHSDKNILDLVHSYKQHELANVTELMADTIYSMFVIATDLHTMRAVEPSLRIRYQDIECPSQNMSSNVDINAKLVEKCVRSRSYSFGSRSQLAKLILSDTDKNPSPSKVT